jgi:3-oxoacyl-[acyl-carrier protein] reductase
MKLSGKVALVTGGSRGLGLAIARALSADGAGVACIARDAAEVSRAVAALTAEGRAAWGIAADVTSAADITRAVDATLERWKRLDIVVLNAGGWLGAPIENTSEADWDKMLDLNLKGAFLTLRGAIPALRESRGLVVGIGSLSGLVGQVGGGAYTASKWGLRGLLESAALELKPHGIRVSLVHPHNMNTAGPPIAPGSPERDRMIDPEDVASLIAWIVSAPEHVSVGNVTIWPRAAGITSF